MTRGSGSTPDSRTTLKEKRMAKKEMTKEQALAKIEELKRYVEREEKPSNAQLAKDIQAYADSSGYDPFVGITEAEVTDTAIILPLPSANQEYTMNVMTLSNDIYLGKIKGIAGYIDWDDTIDVNIDNVKHHGHKLIMTRTV